MSHKSVDFQQSEEGFYKAVALPQPERAEFLRELPSNVAVEVQALLHADAALNALPTSPFREVAASVPSADRPALIADADSHTGTLAGRYRLLHVLGHGGMGVVYLAERTDDQAISAARQLAAVKLLHRALPTGFAAQSFLQERDTLAQLSHAGIARLLDAGSTEDGRAYVAMEYVDGRHIDAFADDPQTTARELLPVLEQLCEAVAEAHRNLILHRDLKPSNILVTDEHRAKLLDFGTRQLLDRTGVAAVEGIAHALTPRYASPEQMEARVLSTASDIYSLGLTLYRLFAGALPPLLERQLSLPAYLRQSRAKLVPPPLRRTQAQRLRLSRRETRDLNAIVLRSMCYAQEDRYSSVAALQEDLRAVRTGGRVRARGDGWRYRTLLVLRTHRVDFTVVLLAALLLLAGVLFSAHQKHRALALKQRTLNVLHAEQQLAHFLIFDYFDQLQEQPGSIPAQRIAATEALRSLDELERHSMDNALRIDAVEGYTRLGKLMGSPYEQDLGDVPAATATLRHAVQLAAQLSAAGESTPAAREAEEAARTGMAQVLTGEAKFAEVPGWINPAVRVARAAVADPNSSAASLLRAAVTLNTFGDLYGQETDMALHDGPKSIAIFREAQTAYLKGMERDPDCSACRSGMAVESWKLGMLHRFTDSEVAAGWYRQALQAIESLPPAELAKALARRRHIFIRQRLAEAEQAMGHLALALQLDQAARADCLDVVAQSPGDLQSRRDLTDIAGELSPMYLQAHQPQQAVAIAREYLATEEEMARLSPHSTMWRHLRFGAEDSLSHALYAAGDKREAKSMQARAVADAIRFAEPPEAPSNVLSLAALVLTTAHTHPDKAVLYAERNMKDNTDPAGDELLELARAEVQAGHRQKAAAALIAANAFFTRHPRAPEHDASMREIGLLQARIPKLH